MLQNYVARQTVNCDDICPFHEYPRGRWITRHISWMGLVKSC